MLSVRVVKSESHMYGNKQLSRSKAWRWRSSTNRRLIPLRCSSPSTPRRPPRRCLARGSPSARRTRARRWRSRRGARARRICRRASRWAQAASPHSCGASASRSGPSQAPPLSSGSACSGWQPSNSTSGHPADRQPASSTFACLNHYSRPALRPHWRPASARTSWLIWAFQW